MPSTNTDPEPVFKDCRQMISELEFQTPDVRTFFKVIWCSIKAFFVERPGQILGSAVFLLMVWGYHGNLELLGSVWSEWRPPGVDLQTRPELITGLPWANELISFWGGAFLVVVIPILLIKFVYRQPLSAYGLGSPPPDRRRFALLAFLILMALVPIFALVGSQNDAIRELYPLYRPFTSDWQFILYELTYLPFFVAIEFIFRGYLLFGLAGIRDRDAHPDATTRRPGTPSENKDTGVPGVYYFAHYALLIQMLSYTAWHLGKPVAELWGTLIWGLVAGAVAYASRSLWYVILAHWLLNVILDAIIVGII